MNGYSMELKLSELRQLQLVQLEMLRVVDHFCIENHLHYSLYDGTLLGAVRHKGFIPWDDDLDICMERSEYERFIQLWNQNPPEGYLLQNKDNAAGFTQSFTKIRKEHTTFLQNEWEAGRYQTGIFIDVFPIDRLPDGGINRKLFLVEGMFYQLLNREFIPPQGSWAEKMVSRAFLACIPKQKRSGLRKKLLADMLRRGKGGSETVAIETLWSMRIPLPGNLTEDYVQLPFEDGNFMCFGDWKSLLERHFGDYMTLPPEEERTWKHHPIILDFEHDYEELQRTGE